VLGTGENGLKIKKHTSAFSLVLRMIGIGLFQAWFQAGDTRAGKNRNRRFLQLEKIVVVPSTAGGNSSFELHSQSTEERANLDRYHHFHGHSGKCAFLASFV